MLILQILILAVLLLIFLQDIKSRSVYWFWFPVLMILFICQQYAQHRTTPEILQQAVINLAFIAVQLLMVSAYFSIKNKRWVNIANELLGWGDILFLLSIAFYFSVLNFLFFYMLSLFVVLVLWLAWQALPVKKNKQIPLAGFQAIILIVLLTSDWYYLHFNLMDDTWLLDLVNK